MTVYLMLYLCTSAALDDCQAFVADRWEGPQALTECRASVAPTLEHLRWNTYAPRASNTPLHTARPTNDQPYSARPDRQRLAAGAGPFRDVHPRPRSLLSCTQGIKNYDPSDD